MKKLLTLLLAVLMVLCLAGCGQKEETVVEEEKEAYKVWFVAPLATGSAWGTCGTSFLAECEALGIEGKYEGPIQAADIPAMIDLCEQAIADGTDVLICNWRDYDSFNEVAQRAKDAGIKLLGYNQPLNDGLCDNYLGIDPSKLGEVLAETLVENRGAEGLKVLYLGASATSQSHLATEEAFKNKLAELAPTAEVEYDYTSGSADTAAEKVNSHMNANAANAIVCNCSFAAVAAAAYKEENNLTSEQLYVQGIDTGADILQYIKDGVADNTIVQDWVGAGKMAADLALKLINGEEIEIQTKLGAYPLYPAEVEEFAKNQGIELQ